MKKKQMQKLAAKLILNESAGSLQLFKEFLLQSGFFDEKDKNKEIWNLLAVVQSKIREIRKKFIVAKKTKVNTVTVEEQSK